MTNSSREADEYFELTKTKYDAGLWSAAENLVNLYPNYDYDLYYAAFPADSIWMLFGFVESDVEGAKLMAQVRNEQDRKAALALVKATKDEDDLRDYYVQLVAFNSSSPGAARIIKQQGDYAGAALFLDEALALIQTDEYITEQLAGYGGESFVTGPSGCGNIIDEYLDLYKFSGEETYMNKAQNALEVCADIAKTKYADGVDGSDISIEEAIEANSRAFAYGDMLDVSSFKDSALAVINANFAKIADDEYSSKIDNLRQLGNVLALSQDFNQAQAYYDQGIEQLNLLENSLVAEEVGEETDDFFDVSNSKRDYFDFVALLKQTAGKNANYAEQFTAAKAKWVAVIEQRLAELAGAADQQKLTFLPLYAQQYIALDMYDEALAIAENEVFGVVEKENIITAIALSMSLENDFIASGVSSVDTDNDGLANFYHEFVSEEDIAASGIALDSDSDNDGTDDADDAFPLDPTKQ